MSKLIAVENEHSLRLQDRGFGVFRGFNDEIIDVLHSGANDPTITAFTFDAARFATVEKTRAWIFDESTGRVMYNLVGAAIVGVAWFRPKVTDMSPARVTYAIRTYGGARGKGLAGDFLEATHQDFAASKR